LRTDTRTAWVERFRSVDACVEPVLLPQEVPVDSHHRSRGVFDRRGAPRSPWSSAVDAEVGSAPALGQDTEGVLRAAGVDDATRAKVLARVAGSSSE
jgi:crotonobetainyl-CoA:carnitine CoA-transferase CaiB-like acyl-CoA transferase